MVDKIDSLKNNHNYFNKVDAVKLYTDTNNRSVMAANGDNPFANTRGSLGLWQQPTKGYIGQVNGEPPAQYTNKNGFTEEVQRTFTMFA